ncbi:PadR family transcriptional regulator [Erysipelotrichaceae bacterium OH741_COT-311]|nr:PadR family transcriptional regulator [Erysipelotrichaceae bacterium]RRC92761.1 PadR family transcriptional regulator [Erysipelotrichaceae bacterium OH741_COT-311]
MRDNISSGALTETTLLVLLSLYRELHGYGVKLFIEEITNGRVVLGMGTLYGAIKNLVEKAWIIESSRVDGKVNYIITELGKEQVKKEEVRLCELKLLIKNIRGEEHEEN